MVYTLDWSNLCSGIVFSADQSVHKAGRYLAFVSHHLNAISVVANDLCHFVKVRVTAV